MSDTEIAAWSFAGTMALITACLIGYNTGRYFTELKLSAESEPSKPKVVRLQVEIVGGANAKEAAE